MLMLIIIIIIIIIYNLFCFGSWWKGLNCSS